MTTIFKNIIIEMSKEDLLELKEMVVVLLTTNDKKATINDPIHGSLFKGHYNGTWSKSETLTKS
jgi:hypothetical protein